MLATDARFSLLHATSLIPKGAAFLSFLKWAMPEGTQTPT